MPLYYFHVANGDTILDEDGTDFNDLQSVKIAAIKTSGEMLRDFAPQLAIASNGPWSLWVTDKPQGQGNTLLKLEFTVDTSGRLPPSKGTR
jgi:hypothetical protein